MTLEYNELLLEMVHRGVLNKADKMNPKQMYDKLWNKYHLYSLPSEHVICNSINTLLDKIAKEGKEPKMSCNKTKALSNKLQKTEEEIIVALKGKLSQKGWQRMKPAYVFARLIMKPMMKKNKVTKKEIEDLSKRIRSRFSSMKTQKKNRLAKLLKN
jgi:hypothetical protein